MAESNDLPLISVVIIGKNEQETIENCILSIFNQCYPNLEVIYVDDKSTDNTFEKAERLKNSNKSKKCKRYITILTDSGLPSKNRNIGIKNSKGSIVAFIDADCIAKPDWLANLFSKFSTGVGIVGGPNTLIHSKNSISTRAIDLVLSSYLGSGGSTQFYKINEDREALSVSAANMAIHRHVLEECGGFDEKLRYNEDSDLCYNVRKNGYRIIYTPKVRIDHHIGIDSYTDFISYFKVYGFERGKNIANNLNFITTFNVISLALILLGLSLLILSFFSSTALIVLLYLATIILLVEFTVSLRLSILHKSIVLFSAGLQYFITLHIMYNIGFMAGLIVGIKQIIFGKR